MDASDAVFMTPSDPTTGGPPYNITTYGTPAPGQLGCQPPPTDTIYTWTGLHGLLGTLGRRRR